MTTESVAQAPRVVSKKDASVMGLTRYFTGTPCLRGHVSERQTSNGTCLECIKENKRAFQINHAEKLSKYRADYRKRNVEKYAERNRRYYVLNRVEVRRKQAVYSSVNSRKAVERAERWNNLNPDVRAATLARRRARLRGLIPPWFGEFDVFVWREAAHLVKLRNLSTGIKWNADHIVPVGGRDVTGFHVAHNCQVIPAVLNRRKSNRLVFTSISEWIALL
jgi:hypothetical protein